MGLFGIGDGQSGLAKGREVGLYVREGCVVSRGLATVLLGTGWDEPGYVTEV